MTTRVHGQEWQRSSPHDHARAATGRSSFRSAHCWRRWKQPSVNSAQTVVENGFLRDGAIMLGVALLFVTLFRRLGLGATLGYIVAGGLIGPSVLGLFNEPEAIQRV